jgi:hypothetical protein
VHEAAKHTVVPVRDNPFLKLRWHELCWGMYASYTNPFLYEDSAYNKSEGDHGSHQDMIFGLGDGGEEQVGTAHQKWLQLVSPLAKFSENWEF